MNKLTTRLLGNTTVWVWLITLFIFFYYLSTIRHGHGWGDDFSQYILHAKNIVNGVPYKKTGYITNSVFSIAPEVYPPIFPLLLAPVYAARGLDIDALKVPGIVCFCGFLVCFFFLVRDYIGARSALFSVVLLGFNPFLWDNKENILSEYPFMFFLFLTFLVILKLWPGNQSSIKLFLRHFIAGILIYLVIGTRSVGLVVLPSFILHEIFKNERAKYWYLYILVTVIVVGGLLILQNFYLNSSGESYQNQLQNYFSFKQINLNLKAYLQEFAPFWSGDGGSLGQLILYLILISSFSGLILCARNRITILELFTMAYLAVIYLWPMYQGNRFLLPVVPLMLLYSLYFCNHFDLKAGQKIVRPFYLSVFSLLTLSYFWFHYRADLSPKPDHIEDLAAQEFFTFVRYLPEDSRLVFDKPRVLVLYTERSAGVAPFCTENVEDLGKFFKEKKINYLALFSDDRTCRYDFVNMHPEAAPKVFENKSFVVYKIQTEKF
jgi:4-amino-4-deoxy-L-arabinose transferase-like glycosyltransferase